MLNGAKQAQDGLCRPAVLFLAVVLLMVIHGLPRVAGQPVTHNITEAFLDDFICTGNASTPDFPLAGNSANLETLRQWCAADSRCAELYGQSGAPNPAVFNYLFQTTLSVPVSTVYLETPLQQLLCNMTAQEFLMAGWVLLLTNQILDAGVCDVNESPRLNPGGAGVTCVCQAGKTCDSDGTSNLVLGIIFIVAVVLAVVAQFGVTLWNHNRLAMGQGYVPPPAAPSAPGPAGAGFGRTDSGSSSGGGARYRARSPHV